MHLPYYIDEETARFQAQVEQHLGVINQLLHDCGTDYYTIGAIREHVRKDKNTLEVWFVPLTEIDFAEFDRFVPMYDYNLLFHVVNWPEHWNEETGAGED